MIYLDNSATTKPDDEVVKSFEQVTHRFFANPSSIHKLGAEVEQLHMKAREQAAMLLEVSPEEIIFTSGGTEGNNIALKGIALEYQQRGKHIVTTEIEHASVYETCKGLESLGFEVTYLPVDENGLVNIKDVTDAIRPDTILVSIMQVNNEIGTIEPINEIGELLKAYPKVFFHVDAVQALGKIPIKLAHSGIDLCTFSGHKINGLNGTGMLYKKKGTRIFPLFHGGGQEGAVRSGTENVAGNVAFVKALRLIKEKEAAQKGYLQMLKQQLLHGLEDLEGVELNSTEQSAPHIINVSVAGLKPEVVIHSLFEKGYAISTQSACSSKDMDKSRVLSACGKSYDQTISGLRISLAYETTKDEMDSFLHAFSSTIKELKQILR